MDMLELCVESLVELGFTRLEAEVYVHLVQHSPATGYGVAKAIGRPNSNTYRAIATLQTKGAILVDDADTKQFHAVPYAELLDQIGRRFEQRRLEAATHMSKLNSVHTDDRIYQLNTVDQMYTRCRRMLAECEKIALIDIFPEPLRVLKTDIEAAAARGVNVLVQVYEPATLEGVDVTLRPHGEEELKAWPLQAVLINMDGLESLIAAVDNHNPERVLQCCWTASPFLAYVLLAYARSEFLLSHLKAGIDNDMSAPELKVFHDKWRQDNDLATSPGNASLRAHFSSGAD